MHRLIDYRGLLITGLILSATLMLLAGTAVAEKEAPPRPQDAIRWDTAQLMSTTSNNGAFIPVLDSAPDGTMMLMYNHRINSSTNNPYYRRKPPGGAWSAPQPVYSTATDSVQVVFKYAPDGTAHAIWRTTNTIQHARESQWPVSTNIVANVADPVFDPSLTIDGDGTLHVVWARQTASGQNIYHAYSRTAGSTWNISAPLATDDRRSSVPDIDVDENGVVHVVWEERIFDISIPGFRFEVQYKKAVPSGPNYIWDSSPTVLSAGELEAKQPTITADGTDLHVAYANQISNEEQYAYYVQFTSGSGWSAPTDATKANPVSVNTSSPFFLITDIMRCNGTLIMTYHGSPVVDAKEQVWSSEVGQSGWLPRTEVTDGQVRTVNPSVTCAMGQVHVVFEEIVDPGVNHQIYYAAGDTYTVILPIIFRK